MRKKWSKFRVFCQEKWFEHKDEILMWERKPVKYKDKDYIRKNRWNLKKMFKEKTDAD